MSSKDCHHAHQVAGAILLGLLPVIAGCGTIGLFQSECDGPQVLPLEEPRAPIPKALRYLRETQLWKDRLVPRSTDYAGNWPQCFALRGHDRLVRDASPFMATFIHHALSLISEDSQSTLGLSSTDVQDARATRKAAIELMLRFQASPDRPDSGTFGFWPPARAAWLPGDILLERLARIEGQGPILLGYRAPINVTFFPAEFAIFSDADDTATIYAALADHARLDGGPAVRTPLEQFFGDWRDRGVTPLRNHTAWLPEASGAFLTWLAYGDGGREMPNDVDLVVNANVLYALGRYDRLDTPGVPEAVDLINRAVGPGTPAIAADELSLYYPDNLALHYCVSRAYREGGVAGLKPAVDGLVDGLLSTVLVNEVGLFYWDRGGADLNTAFAVLTLLNAGEENEIIRGAIDYLISRQNADLGSWQPAAFFRGRFESGAEAVWTSSALTTAMALEALCRWQLVHNDSTTISPG